MTIDLSNAINCINYMKSVKTYDGQKIGLVREDFGGMGFYSAGEVVLYREELREGSPSRRVTVEKPLTPEGIESEKERGSFIATVGVMINVPKIFLEEVVLESQ